MPAKTGLDALLRSEDSILVLIDHQPYQFTNLNSHDPTMIINNVIGLAKTAKVFDVPTILTTVIEERGGYLIKGLQDVFPEQKPINRTFINTWEDPKVVDVVRKSGRKQLVLAALYTEICLVIPFRERLDRRHGEADLGVERSQHELRAPALLHDVGNLRVFPDVDEGTVDRLLLGEYVLQRLDEFAAAIFQHRAQDGRHVENLGGLGQRDDVVHDHRRLVAVQVGELKGLVVDHDQH